MNSSFQPNNTRVIELDLELYTDGDPELRRELIEMMIENVRELQQSLKGGIDIFRKTSHKVKPTISMLNDKDLIESIEEITLMPQCDHKKISSFQRLCNDIIKILECENS